MIRKNLEAIVDFSVLPARHEQGFLRLHLDPGYKINTHQAANVIA